MRNAPNTQAGVDFVDERIDIGGEQWRDLKPRTPFGVLPVLETDGHMLGGVRSYRPIRRGEIRSGGFE